MANEMRKLAPEQVTSRFAGPDLAQRRAEVSLLNSLHGEEDSASGSGGTGGSDEDDFVPAKATQYRRSSTEQQFIMMGGYGKWQPKKQENVALMKMELDDENRDRECQRSLSNVYVELGSQEKVKSFYEQRSSIRSQREGEDPRMSVQK